jgi:hypothetical protein
MAALSMAALSMAALSMAALSMAALSMAAMTLAAAELVIASFGPPTREAVGFCPSPGSISSSPVRSIPFVSGNFPSPERHGLCPRARRSARRADTALSEGSGEIRLEPTAGLAGKLVTRSPWLEIAVSALTSRLPSAATLGSCRELWWESERRGGSGAGARTPTIAGDAQGEAPAVDKSLIGSSSCQPGHDDDPNGPGAAVGGPDSRPREGWMSRGRDRSLVESWHDDDPNGPVAAPGDPDSRPREDWMGRGRDPMSGVTRGIGRRCAAPRLPI